MTCVIDARQAGEPRIGDAFGQALLDYLEHGPETRGHFIERDDGLLEALDPGLFFTGELEWSAVAAAVAERAGPRVLDVGASVGRHALPLQEARHEVVALDTSVGAIEVGRRRGVRETFIGTIFELAETDGERFDTVLLCGNNFGLLESREHASTFLGALTELAAPCADIIGTWH